VLTLIIGTWNFAGEQFPIKMGTSSKWNWASDGSKVDGSVELLADKGVKWKNVLSTGGSWELKDSEKILKLKFNSVEHELRYKDGKAIVMIPSRTPPSIMTMISM
jgi:hypothetical protein